MQLKFVTMVGLLPAAIAGGTTSAFAQEALNEIIVTARKTTETQQDVPVSVAVTQGEKIEKMSINGLEGLSEFTPNLQINENATQQTVTIRGIGSGANQAFEQSVGTYIDGVYFGRGRSARNPFHDIERVEIIKGPQGTLFGKNTVAGAINITTRKPNDYFEGFAQAEYLTDVDKFGLSGAVSGPLANNIRARLTANYQDQRGYVHNTFTGKDEARTEEYLVRGIIVFDATDDLEITLKGEIGSYDVKGRVAQNVGAGPLEALYLSIDPEFETDLDYDKSSIGDDFDNTDTHNVTATIEYRASDAWDFTSITSIVGYDFVNNIPAEFGPLDYAKQANKQKHKQFSQELRGHFQSDGAVELVGGLYFGTEDLDIEETFNFNFTNLINAGVAIFPLDSSIITDFQQNTDSFAAFGELRYNITEQVRATFGLRYTIDKKDVDKELIVAELGTQMPDPTQLPLAAIIGRIPHSYSLSRKDKDLTPSFGLQYFVTDDIMFYGTYSEGFKSGGFDAQNTSGSLDLAAFEPESVKAFEAGSKMTLAQGKARLNMSYFNNKFKSLQVSAFNGLTFATNNAASATTQGIEIDGQWRPTNVLTLGASAAWLDSTYDDFPNSTCTAPQQVAFAANTGLPAGRCVQDLSGRKLQFSPSFAGTFNATYEADLTDNLELSIQGDVNFTSSYFTAQDLDPVSKQDGFAKVNLRLAIGDPSESWSIALIGRNLTNKKTTTWVNDIPVFRGAYFGFIDPPRSFGVQFRTVW